MPKSLLDLLGVDSGAPPVIFNDRDVSILIADSTVNKLIRSTGDDPTSITLAGNLSSSRVLVGDGTVAAPAIAFTAEPGLGMYRRGTGSITRASAGSAYIDETFSGGNKWLSLESTMQLGFSSGSPAAAIPDTFLTRISAGLFGTASSMRIASGTAVPAGGTAAIGYMLSSTANLGLFFGSGLPTLSAAQGSIYIRTDGSSSSTRLYINSNGSTTWVNVTTAT